MKSAFENEDHQKSKNLWKEIMSEVDKNGDGVISYDEFFNAMTAVVKGNDRVK